MTENVPPGSASKVATKEDAGPRGLPYYEKLRRDLRDTLNRKRQLDRNLVSTSLRNSWNTTNITYRLRLKRISMHRRPLTSKIPPSQAISSRASTITSSHLLSAQHLLAQEGLYQVQQQGVEWEPDGKRQ